MPTPRLIVVTGRPGSGKTTLAHALARELRCPAICRDEIMEGFINTTGHLGAPGHDAALRVYETFFDTIRLLLDRGVTVVAEAAFQHKLWAPKLEPLSGIARIRIIVCALDAELARARRDARASDDPERNRYHPQWPGGDYDPAHLDLPALGVDTSQGYQPDLDSIVAFARAAAAD